MGGLGEAICIKMAALGYSVVTTYSPGNTKANEWLASMKAQGYNFKAYPCDVADWESAAACVKKVSDEVGPVDVLVNNAGITRDMTFKKMDKGNWDAVIKTNLDSCFNMTKQVCDAMASAAGARHQHLLGQRAEGRVRPDQLFGGQSRHARLHQGAGARIRAQRRDVEHDLAGLHRHQDGDGDSEGSARRKIIPQIPMGRSASPRKSPASSRISRARKRRSSPAPTSRSTAASTCSSRSARLRLNAGRGRLLRALECPLRRSVDATTTTSLRVEPIGVAMSTRQFASSLRAVADPQRATATARSSAIRARAAPTTWRIARRAAGGEARLRACSRTRRKLARVPAGVAAQRRRRTAPAASRRNAAPQRPPLRCSGRSGRTWPHYGQRAERQRDDLPAAGHFMARAQDAQRALAIGITPTGAKAPILGVVEVAFDTQTELAERRWSSREPASSPRNFLRRCRAGGAIRGAHQGALASMGVKRVPLAAIVASLREPGAEAARKVALDNTPPRIFVSRAREPRRVRRRARDGADHGHDAFVRGQHQLGRVQRFDDRTWYLLNNGGWLAAPDAKGRGCRRAAAAVVRALARTTATSRT
jgi:acetoacetyl-CoA reductase